MRVPNLTLSDAVLDRLNTLRTKQNSLNQQISTGQRYSFASEDPQSASRVMGLRSEVAITQQYAKNADLATGISEATGSALLGINSISTRARELAALASGGVTSAEERSAYAVEVNQLMLQTMELGNSQYNGQYLFNGTSITAVPFSTDTSGAGDTAAHPTGITAAATVVAGSDGLQIQLADSLTLSPYSRGANNEKLTTFMNNLRDLRNAMEQNDSTALATAQTALKTSEGDIVNAVAEVSASRGRLDSIKDAASKRFSDIGVQLNNETDVDIAQTLVDLTKVQTAYQAALQAGGEVLKLSLLDYIR